MAPRPIIIDCDTGRDDALAIAFALASPADFHVLGIATVAGNVPVALAFRNSRFVTELCGRGDVRVFEGAAKPIAGTLTTAEHVHGDSGLEGIEVTDPVGKPEAQPAVDFIVESLRAAPDDSITLVVTGPATNIALAIGKAPDILPRIRSIALMGGAWREVGNVTPSAEFNIYVDPRAAQIVLDCGRPITMISLDVTNRVLARARHAARLESGSGKAARILASLLRPLPSINRERHGEDAIPLHDPCTLAVLSAPNLFTLRDVNVEIELHGQFTTGATVVDYWRRTSRKPNVSWAAGVDVEGVLELLTDRLLSLP